MMVPIGIPMRPTQANTSCSVRPYGLSFQSPIPHASCAAPRPASKRPIIGSGKPESPVAIAATEIRPTSSKSGAPMNCNTARTVMMGRSLQPQHRRWRPPAGAPQAPQKAEVEGISSPHREQYMLVSRLRSTVVLVFRRHLSSYFSAGWPAVRFVLAVQVNPLARRSPCSHNALKRRRPVEPLVHR